MKKAHHYSSLAVFLGLLAVSAAIAGKIFADDTVNSTVSSSTIVCSYVTEDWSTCVNGKQTRVVTPTPSGCYPDPNPSNIPQASRECVYTTPCTYTYSEWSPCTALGYRTRSVIGMSPSGCYQATAPAIKQECAQVACTYSYSNWSSCSSTGRQVRTITAKTPTGCIESAIPILEQTCNPSSTTTTTTTTSTSSSSVTKESSTSATTGTLYQIEISNPEIIPKVQLNFGDGMVITDKFKAEAKVSNALAVEWYSLQTDSNIAKYIGSAKKMDETTWVFLLDPAKFPNGTYQMKARVKNIYGSYDSDRKTIVIINPTISNLESEQRTTVADNNVAAPQTNFNGETSAEWQKKFFGAEYCLQESFCGGNVDLDKDGITNNEEFRLGTDPKNPDTDLDGFLDGDEIKGGFNPTKSSPGDRSDKIIFETPKETGEIKKDLFEVKKVELVETDNQKKIKLSGKAIPNAFVTIYIYSEPIILTVKTDSEGNWTYELDKELEDGNHEAYVAVTDNTGKITGKSEPIAFVKSAQAVTVIPPVEAANAQEASPTALWYKTSIIFFIAIALGAVALALAVVGIILHKRNQNQQFS